MKQKLQKILAAPKIVISVALCLALIIGVASSIAHKKALAERSAKVAAISTTITGIGDSNASSKDLTLAFPVGGRIKSVSVKIGDTVKAGTILAHLDAENALGAVNQAKAAYSAAQIAYDKLVNGASTPDIEVAKVALNNAKNTYSTTVAQQKGLVANALSAMLSSGLVALPAPGSANTAGSPVISGMYTGTGEGTYTITTYATNHFSVSGLENMGDSTMSNTPLPLGARGLYIQFSSNFLTVDTTWTVSVPNTQSSAYLTYHNAYQSALQNQAQAIAVVQSAVDTAQAVLNQKLASARSEDLAIAKAQVESTQGALQIALGTYNNTIIIAPVDGTITNVTITAGQIATPNTPAIEILSQ